MLELEPISNSWSDLEYTLFVHQFWDVILACLSRFLCRLSGSILKERKIFKFLSL